MKRILLYTFGAIVLFTKIYGMENNNNNNTRNSPLNAPWFYNPENPCYQANRLLQDQDYKEAAAAYLELLKRSRSFCCCCCTKPLNDEDKKMASLNYALCMFAQGKEALEWQVFDHFAGIPESRRIKNIFKQSSGTTFVVKTDYLDVGDIVHFVKAIKQIPESTLNAKVYLVAPEHLHKMLEGPSQEYEFNLINEERVDQIEGVQIHLASILGYWLMIPDELSLDKAIYTASKRAITAVEDVLYPFKEKNKQLCPVFIGEDRVKICIGGRRIPHAKKRGRYLDARMFETLLKTYPDIILVDANPKNIRILFDADNYRGMSSSFEDRVVQIPDEEDAFDTTLALALYSNREKLIGFGADHQSAQVFMRALSFEEQNNFSFIIPGESDICMANPNSDEKLSYFQGLSSCKIYQCERPEDQEDIIIQAYKDMQEQR